MTDPPAQPRRHWLLAAYGCFALVLGITDFVRGGFMVFATRTPAEVDFVGHLLQAHASTLVGLGCAAVWLSRTSGQLRPVFIALFLGNVLWAYVQIPAALRGAASILLGIVCVLWAICFLWLSFATARQGLASTQATPPPDSPDVFDRVNAFSFSILLVLSGVAWVFAAPRFAAAAAGSLAGAAAVFTGQTRGAADFALGAMAWLTGTRRDLALVRWLVLSSLLANFLLVIAGTLAQLSVLSIPARWVVCGLHALWTLGFARQWYRLPRRHP